MITFWSIFLAILLLLVTFAAIYGVYLWMRRRLFTRERFAFAGLAALTTMTTLLLVSFSQHVMPWDIVAAFLNHFWDLKISISEPKIIDYLFLIAIYAIATFFIITLHKNWAGLKSVDQYRREQRSEASGVLTEGVYEMRRIAARRPSPDIYNPNETRDHLAQLEAVTDSLAWKDQARELLRLSSSSYVFDPEEGWHDIDSVWVGTVHGTDELVFLFPTFEIPSDADFKKFSKSAYRLANFKKNLVCKLVVAVRGNPDVGAMAMGETFQVTTEAELLDNLVNWTDYINEISRRVKYVRLPDSELTLDQVYVPPMCLAEGETEHPAVDACLLLSEWAKETSQRQLAILGGYGQGKSTTALFFTYHALTQEEIPARIPVLIELRGTSPRNLTPLQLLGAWSAQYNINPKALLRLHIAGRLMLIFEGFDEMALVGDSEMRLKHFRTLWQFCYPNAKIVITGRPNFFLDEIEMKSALGIHEPISGKAFCEAFRLVPFDRRQIADSLREHDISVRNQIVSLVDSNQRFRELVSRPSLLHIVSVLWRRENLSKKVDQLDSAFIMDLFVRHSYRRQGRKEIDSPEFMALTSAEREYFMQGVAACMAALRLPNQISSFQLNSVVEMLVECAPDSLSQGVSALGGEVRKPLRERLAGSEHGIDHVKTDVRACGLLVDDPSAPGTFRFGHKSFMEFLFAAVLADLIGSEKEKSKAIMRATNADIGNLIHLPVSVDFLAEMLASGEFRKSTNSKNEFLNTQELVARRILYAVLGGKGWSLYISRFFVFFDCAGKTLFGFLPGGFRVVARTVIALIFTFFFYSIVQGILPQGGMLFLAFAMPLALGFPETVVRVVLGRRMKLWNVLCVEMNIPDSTMHRIVGTWWLLIFRKQKFNFYLKAEIS